MRGQIIVIEGTDGSGKQTQAELLVKRLKADQIPIATISFPQYNTPPGRIIGGPYLGKPEICLTWFQEGPNQVDPRVSALYYAADRVYNISKVKELLDQGINVILDRYVISNMAHQGGKIKEQDKRLQFYEWLAKLEYELLELPLPDLTILLYMPYQYSLELRKKRPALSDGHEAVKEHLLNAEASYLELAELYNFQIINCVKANKIRTIKAINDELYLYLKTKLKAKEN